MKEQILEEIGLSRNEAKIFVSLLDLGSSTAGKIAEKSNVHRTNVYDALERLIEKGLVSFVIKGKIKLFESTDPKILMSLIKEKENKLQTIMPQLLLSQQLAKDKSEAHIYQGVVAVRNMLNHFVELGQPRYTYGVPKRASEMITKCFLENYHRRRANAKIPMKMIYNSDAKERVKWLNKQPYTETRYSAPDCDSPVSTTICGDEVVMTLYDDTPLTIQIKNAKIAQAYKRYFDVLWSHANDK